MSDSLWRKYDETRRLPRGTRWSATRGFFIDPPSEPRPFFDALMRDPDLTFSTIISDGNDAYMHIITDPDAAGNCQVERLTISEYALLAQRGGMAGPPLPELLSSNPDMLVRGAGPLISFNFSRVIEPFLQSGERGLILQSGIRVHGDEIYVRSGFEPEELRSMLLLWDRFDWPDHSRFSTEIDPNAQWLIDNGLMRRTKKEQVGTLFSKSDLANFHLTIFDEVEPVEPGRWAIGSGSASAPEIGNGRAIMVELHEALLLPTAEVPFETILEFKERRRDELHELRTHLRELSEIIIASADPVAALADKAEALARAIESQKAVAGEAGFGFGLGRLRSTFTAENIAEAAAGGAAEWAKSGQALQAAVGFGQTLAVKAFTGLFKTGVGPGPLRYVFSAQKEIGARSYKG